jgi:hypothetical protein
MVTAGGKGARGTVFTPALDVALANWYTVWLEMMGSSRRPTIWNRVEGDTKCSRLWRSTHILITSTATRRVWVLVCTGGICLVVLWCWCRG